MVARRPPTAVTSPGSSGSRCSVTPFTAARAAHTNSGRAGGPPSTPCSAAADQWLTTNSGRSS
ncbi:hypothetical protein ABZ442_16485 [Streptomyces triculaminicus]|uniref:hypothetical protein n=1 Tax=Streptomyces triculaminicus TaxID=2816232 RepID=UPI0033E3A4EF